MLSVDFRTAKTTLALPHQFGRDYARRSYLRLLKLHKPERDPQGFQRIRLAWECIDETLRERPWLCGVQDEAVGKEWSAEAPRDDVPQQVNTAVSAEERTSIAQLLDDLQSQRAEISDREALRTIDEVGIAHERPLPELAALAHGQPNADDLRTVAIESEQVEFVRRAFLEQSHDRPVYAAYALAKALTLASRLVQAPRPNIEQCVRTINELLRMDHRRSAQHLATAMATWIDANGGELKTFRSTESMLRWWMAREHAAVSSLLTPRARHLLTESVDVAKSALPALVDAYLHDEPGTAAQTAQALRSACPASAQSLLAALESAVASRAIRAQLTPARPVPAWSVAALSSRIDKPKSGLHAFVVAVLWLGLIGLAMSLAGRNAARSQASRYQPTTMPKFDFAGAIGRDLALRQIDLYKVPTLTALGELAINNQGMKSGPLFPKFSFPSSALQPCPGGKRGAGAVDSKRALASVRSLARTLTDKHAIAQVHQMGAAIVAAVCAQECSHAAAEVATFNHRFSAFAIDAVAKKASGSNARTAIITKHLDYLASFVATCVQESPSGGPL